MPTNWDGTPMRPLEWGAKHLRRCELCKTLGPVENYKPGPFKLVEGKHVRTWQCTPKCKAPRTDHYENTRPPKKYDGEEPPRRVYVETVKYSKRRNKPSAKAEKKDAERIAASTKLTSADALKREGDGDPARHPLLRRKPKSRR